MKNNIYLLVIWTHAKGESWCWYKNERQSTRRVCKFGNIEIADRFIRFNGHFYILNFIKKCTKCSREMDDYKNDDCIVTTRRLFRRYFNINRNNPAQFYIVKLPKEQGLHWFAHPILFAVLTLKQFKHFSAADPEKRYFLFFVN